MPRSSPKSADHSDIAVHHDFDNLRGALSSGIISPSDVNIRLSKVNDNKHVRYGSTGKTGKRDEESAWLKRMETELQKIAGNKTEITLQQFKTALGIKENFFAERLFDLSDSNNNGTTDIWNLLCPLEKVTKGTPTQRLKFLFDMYDVDGDGELDIEDLVTVLRSCMEESSLKLSDDDLIDLTIVLFESADTKQNGRINFDEFRKELQRHPGVIENLSLSAVHWLKPKTVSTKKPSKVILSRETNNTLAEIVLTGVVPLGTIHGSAMIAGWLLDIILVIMIICSLPCVRRSGHFEVFYWTHILYIPFLILLVFHGPNFWEWFLVPGLIFIGEKASRSKFINKARYGKTFIEQVNLLPSSVTHLEISRPSNFAYQPGDYIFLQIPVISKHEWHPFTISSAPELDGRIWLHIRSAGNWTKSLYKYFDQLDPGENKDPEAGDKTALTNPMSRRMNTSVRRETLSVQSADGRTVSVQRRTIRSQGSNGKGGRRARTLERGGYLEKDDRRSLRNKIVNIECYIDGPYGTVTREIFQTEHAVLVGAGIGVTPMASILQSIMYKFKASKRHCPKCAHEWLGELPTENMLTKKVDFIWINRDQKAFEWFLSLLTALEVEQSLGNEDGHEDKLIDMHMYMTAAVKKTDMKGIGLQLALDLMHEKSQRDLITGLKTRTQPGRPDWNQVFKQISSANKGKVKVFFCGAPLLGKTIKTACQRFSFDFAKENF